MPLSSVQAKIIYVTPTGASGNSGTSFSAAMDYATALDKAGAGDTVLMQGGTYTVPYSSAVKNTMNLSKSGSAGKPISVIAHNNSRAICRCTGNEQHKHRSNSRAPWSLCCPCAENGRFAMQQAYPVAGRHRVTWLNMKLTLYKPRRLDVWQKIGELLFLQ